MEETPYVELLSIGDVADRVGLQCWRVRKLIERRLVPEPPLRLGRNRVFRPEAVEQVRAAATAAGYYRPRRGPGAAMAV